MRKDDQDNSPFDKLLAEAAEAGDWRTVLGVAVEVEDRVCFLAHDLAESGDDAPQGFALADVDLQGVVRQPDKKMRPRR